MKLRLHESLSTPAEVIETVPNRRPAPRDLAGDLRVMVPKHLLHVGVLEVDEWEIGRDDGGNAEVSQSRDLGPRHVTVRSKSFVRRRA